jgi:hypothetical protein
MGKFLLLRSFLKKKKKNNKIKTDAFGIRFY